ncbi:hypothetical protein NON00_20845 [Roseomonas sp. GC11]|uniref:hypothetical protein n=1 Tax=Roseomonas sp. GC11 TaxID=2950546 RepID=UPI00210EB3C8|nr:hypothetical protein [Roseomonas sp. GC11]MCQ4162364.1 hypothetical protein [Roseomonas sp. GC11]
MRVFGSVLAAVFLAACGGAGEAGHAAPAAAPPPPESDWEARVADGVCVLVASARAAKVQFAVRPATVALAMGRFDGAGPQLNASRSAEIVFSGPAGTWSLTGLPVAQRAFGLSRQRKHGGLDLVHATLAGGEFRSPQLDLAFSVPPAAHVGEAFLACVAALPPNSAP